MKFFQNIWILFIFIINFKQAISANKVPEGTLKLIIETYLQDLIASTDVIDEIIKAKLLSLGDHIVTHPALHQDHFHVGSKIPDYDPVKTDHYTKRNSLSKRQKPNLSEQSKTNDDLPSQENFPSDEICSTNRQWEQINTTHDFYEKPVDVVHKDGLQQFIYTYRCATTKNSCMGISPLYHSECTERYGWVYMYHQRKGEEQPKWGYVAAPHHCACKLQPRFNPSTSKKR